MVTDQVAELQQSLSACEQSVSASQESLSASEQACDNLRESEPNSDQAAAAERAIHADATRRGARAPLPAAHSWPDHDTAAEALLAGPASYCSPRHRMPFNSIKYGSTCVSMTWRAGV